MNDVSAAPREFWELFYPDWDVHEWLEDAFHEYVLGAVESEETKAEIFQFYRLVDGYDVRLYRDKPSEKPLSLFTSPVTPEHHIEAEKNLRAELSKYSDNFRSWLPIAEKGYLYAIEKYFRPDVTATERKMAEQYFYEMRDRLLSVKTD